MVVGVTGVVLNIGDIFPCAGIFFLTRRSVCFVLTLARHIAPSVFLLVCFTGDMIGSLPLLVVFADFASVQI